MRGFQHFIFFSLYFFLFMFQQWLKNADEVLIMEIQPLAALSG